MIKELFTNLRLFGDGGDGGASAGEASADTSGENNELASIPEKAKGAYKIALEKTRGKSTPAESTEAKVSDTEGKLSYADLIKSDDYREDHKAYMEKTINDRLKKYKGMEETNAKMKSVMDTIATKYGLDSNSDDFVDALTKAVDEDNSYFEKYAMDHDMTVEQARSKVDLERRVAAYEANEHTRMEQEQMRQEFARVQENAVKTKQMYPEFDLEVCLQDANFARICKATNGDTTTAYIATHWKNVIPQQVKIASEQASQQIANTVKSNLSRPIENGLSSRGAIVQTPNLKGMSARELKEYAYNNLTK